jgi:hypothetical protein
MALQVFLIRNMVLFDVSFCFAYIAFILLLPFDTSPLILLLLGFSTGLLVDVFYDTLGMHAAASTLVAYFRTFIIRLNTPRGGYEQNARLSLQSMGMEWFAPYSLILIFLHHAVLFFVEASQLNLFFFTSLKVVASTAFTFVVITLIQYLLFSPRSRN